METTSRRQFIVGGGMLVGLFGVPGLGGAPALAAPRGSAASATALSVTRRETFSGLADAVLTSDAHRLPAAAAEQATQDFAARYADWDGDRRRRADDVLDALERAEGKSFRGADRKRRATVLREHATPTSPTPAGQERKRLDLAEAALELLDAVIGPDSDLDHSPTTL